MKKLLIIALSLFTTSAYAAPVIQPGQSLSLAHNGTYIVTGSGFGTKLPAAPRIWDACNSTSTNDLETFWPGVSYPSTCSGTPSESPYLMEYRNSFHGFSTMPNSRVSKFLSSAAITCNGEWTSPFATNLVTTGDWEVSKMYAIYYYRMSNTWGQHTSEFGDNLKELAANGCVDSSCGTPYNGTDTFLDWCNSQTPMIMYPGQPYIRSGSSSGCGSLTAVPKPMSGWVHYEVRWDTTGAIQSISNGSSVVDGSLFALFPIDNAGGTGVLPKTISIGGFTRWPRENSTGNYRYWAALYLDDTYSRVMLGNQPTYAASTIREPQIPSGWADGAVTFRANLGAFNQSQAYLYVFDSNNVCNSTGYLVTLSDAIVTTTTSTVTGTTTTSTSIPTTSSTSSISSTSSVSTTSSSTSSTTTAPPVTGVGLSGFYMD